MAHDTGLGAVPRARHFRRWVADMPELPVDADALLRAREKALDKGDDDDAAELRAQLAKLGVVVRDQKERQYWRRSG
jgi:cysteinyl-tRNA synthetase